MKLVAIVLFCLLVGVGFAQNPEYEMVPYTKSDGLGQNYVYSIIQGERNFLWAGTGNGLAKYDGRNIQSYVKTDSLEDNFITTSTKDAFGNLLFGHYTGGITKYNGIEFTPIVLEGVDKKIIGMATSETSQRSWAISQGGVFVKIWKDEVTIIEKPILADKDISCFTVINDYLFVGSSEGLIIFRYAEGKLDEGFMPEQLEWMTVTSLSSNKENELWIGTEGSGLFKSENIEESEFIKPFGEQFAQYYITSLTEDTYNNLWVGTKRNGSLSVKLDSEISSYQTFDKSSGYPSYINTIYEDNEGSIWLGTVGDGLVQVVKNQFTQYDFEQLFKVEQIAAGVSIDNSYVLATDQGIIQANFNEHNSSYDFATHPDEHIANLNANFLYYDNNGSLWLTTKDGKAYQYHLQTQTLDSIDFPFEEKIKFLAMDMDSTGNYWISISGQGVVKMDPQHQILEHFNTTTGFIHNDIFAILVDLQGNVWFGAKAAGLAILRTDGIVDRLTQKEVFPSRDINDIELDGKGNVWISTDGSGLFKYDGLEFSRYDKSHGLHSLYCGAITIDINDDVWVTHRDGISELNQSRSDKITKYDHTNGIIGGDNFDPIMYDDPKGNVWFVSRHELIRYNPSLQFYYRELQPFVTDLRIFYEKADLSSLSANEENQGFLPENIKLPYDQNHVTFDFVAVSLKKRNSIYYKHKLEGYEEQMSPATTDNSSTYTNLEPGDYSLLVIASDNQYVWPEAPIRYNFTILKPYWERWWFYLLQVGGLIMLVLITLKISSSQLNEGNSRWLLKIMVYVCLFIVFEYVQNFIEPFTEGFIGGAPVFRILINLVLALVLFPVEGLVKAFFYAKSKKT